MFDTGKKMFLARNEKEKSEVRSKIPSLLQFCGNQLDRVLCRIQKLEIQFPLKLLQYHDLTFATRSSANTMTTDVTWK